MKNRESEYEAYLADAKNRFESVQRQNTGKQQPAHGARPMSLIELLRDASNTQDGFEEYLNDSIVEEDAPLKIGPIKKPWRILGKLALKMLKIQLTDPTCKTLPYSTEARDVIRAMIIAKDTSAAKKAGNIMIQNAKGSSIIEFTRNNGTSNNLKFSTTLPKKK